MKKIPFILFLFACLTLTATKYTIIPGRNYFYFAATYYVDENGGDAGHTGLIDDPFHTLAYACSQAIAGDSIHVNAGTYTETSQCELRPGVKLGGNIGYPYTSIIQSGWTGDYNDGIFDLQSSSLENGSQTISYLKFDGAGETKHCAISVIKRNGVVIHHCEIVDFLVNGIWNYNGSDNTEPGTYATNNSVHDCIITNSAQSGTETATNGANIKIQGQSGFQVYNCTLSSITRATANGGNFTSHWTRGLKFYDNITYRNDTEPGGHGWNFNTECWFLTGGCEFYGNTSYGAGDYDFVGIKKRGYDFGLKFYDNELLVTSNLVDRGSGGIAINLEMKDSIESVYVYHNLIKNFPIGVDVNGTDFSNVGESVHVKDLYIYYNIFENIGCTGNGYNVPIIFEGKIILPGNHGVFNNINVLNNVMTGNGVSEYGIRFNLDETWTNINIKNNIIKGFANNPIDFEPDWHDPPDRPYSLDYLNITNNIFYLNTSNIIRFDPEIDPLTDIPNYTTGYNYTTDPAWVGGSPYDFNLTTSSTDAINKGAGVSLTGQLDYGGANVIENPPDIGAYEYDGDPPPQPGLPVVTTGTVTSWTINSAYFNQPGVVVDDSGTVVTDRGIVWDTIIYPTILKNKITSGSGDGAMSPITITGLHGGMNIHVRAYATNSMGTSYGFDVSFMIAPYYIYTVNSKVLMFAGKVDDAL